MYLIICISSISSHSIYWKCQIDDPSFWYWLRDVHRSVFSQFYVRIILYISISTSFAARGGLGTRKIGRRQKGRGSKGLTVSNSEFYQIILFETVLVHHEVNWKFNGLNPRGKKWSVSGLRPHGDQLVRVPRVTQSHPVYDNGTRDTRPCFALVHCEKIRRDVSVEIPFVGNPSVWSVWEQVYIYSLLV